jgi:glycosyltransferase involved in cell wall biosynthesis
VAGVVTQPINRGRQIRVVHVLGRLSRSGGIQTSLRRLADHLDLAAVDLHIITARPRLSADELDAVPATVHGMGHTARRHNSWTRVRTALRIASELRRLRPDVVHLHSGTVFLGVVGVLALRRTPVVLQVHDVPGSGRRSRGTDWAEGFFARRFTMTVVCHSLDVQRAVRRRWRVPGERCIRFPLSVDTDTFHPATSGAEVATWRTAHGIGPQTVVLVTVGRFAPVKRLPLMIRALATIRVAGVDAVLAIVGGPATDHDVQRAAAELGVADSVRFLGTVPDTEALARVMRASDIACSTSEYESFGLTLVEAMASGLPVVTTAAGGPEEIIEDGRTGFRVGVDDFDAFVDRVMAVAKDPQLRTQLGAAARARAVALYDAKQMAAAFTALYRRLAENPGNRNWLGSD